MLLLLVLGAASSAWAQAAPRVGLVLSGGGARGGAHLGVLKVLEDLQVPVHVIVGTSAGSIIGAAYASGMPLADIEAEMKPLHTSLLVRDTERADLPMRRKADEAVNYVGPEFGVGAGGLALPKGAIAGVSLEAVLRRLTVLQRQDDFDRLPIPFRAIATDLTTAEMVVLERGSLATAIRASMALPAIVYPVEIDGRLLVDGGASRNLPVDVARAMGADVIIAVNLGTPMHPREELVSVLSVTDQMVRMLTVHNVRQSLRELRPNDVLITPELGTLRTSDFDRLPEAVEAGLQAARAAAPRLARLRLAPEAYAALRRTQTVDRQAPVLVDEVRVAGTRRVDPQVVRDALRVQPGEPFDAADTDADLKRVYGRGDFERVSYVLSETSEGSHVLTADVTEKSWGPHFLRFGLGLSSDFDGNAHFNLLATHRATWLNRLGAEWRNDVQIGHVDRLRSEWYQPLQVSQRVFAAVSIEARREPFDVFVDDLRFARFRREREDLGLDLGLSLGASGELRAGLRRGQVELATDTGIIPGNQVAPRTDTAGLEARLRLDTLDSLRFPREGYALDIGYRRSSPKLGAADRYGKLSAALLGAASIGAHTLRAAAFGDRRTSGEALPDYELASLGGFLRLSGYQTGQFLGTGVRFARVVYSYRITAPGLLDGVHVGVSAEDGRFSDAVGASTAPSHRRGNAIFLAVDTPLGPVYLGHGRAHTGQQATYFYLGLP
jgi:NTE family protein